MDYLLNIDEGLYSLFLIRAGVSNPSNDDDLFIRSVIYEAQQEAYDYCRVDTLPQTANPIIVNMALIKYNQRGTEGIDSHSYSGISEKFSVDYPEMIYRSLRRYRRVKSC